MVTFSLRLNCMAKRGELISRSRGSPWRAAIERRQAIRYPLQLAATFTWEDEEGILRQGEGNTRNISEKGAFVYAAILPPIGSSVELHFSLPALSDSGRKMHVQHTGETLRLEGSAQGEQSGGFAISSRQIVWRYEDGGNFDRSDKEED
jgi:PilZ domain